MKRVSRLAGPSIACMLFAMVDLLGSPASAQNAGQVPFLTWLGSLPRTGTNAYTVTRGGATLFGGCTDYVAALGSCFGNNASTPYILTQPPVTPPTSYLPPYASSSPFQTTLGNGTVTNELWQIANEQAIVTIITLPPQGAYFGFQTYLLERLATDYPPAPSPLPPYPVAPCTAGTLWPNPFTGPHTETSDCNYVMFSYFTNAVNNADVLSMTSTHLQWNNYSGSPPSPTTYNTIAVISTPNSVLAGNLKAAFMADGYDPSQIFIEEMPATAPVGTSPTLNVGVSAAGDDFISVIRYTLSAVTGNGTHAQNGSTIWPQGNNVLVFRVEQPSSALPPAGNGALYDSATVLAGINAQSCNTNETLYAPPSPATAPCPSPASANLGNDLLSIAQTLVTWADANTGHTYAYHLASSGGVPGTTFITQGRNSGGGTQDNDSYRSSQVVGPLVNQYPIFVVGVNHSASVSDFSTPVPVNNATYTGISIADAINNVGVVDTAQANASAQFASPSLLTGSAYAVLNALSDPSAPTVPIYNYITSGAQTDINNIYVHAFWRNPPTGVTVICTTYVCAAGNIYTTFIGDNGGPPQAPNNIPTSDPIKLTERGYILPLSTSGILQPPAALLSGADPNYLQSPYIVCDTAQPQCLPN